MNPDRGSSFLFTNEAPRIDDAFYLENNNPHGFGMDPSDGLPRPVIMMTPEQSTAPQLNPDNFICMADTREFVRAGSDDVTFTADEVERDGEGGYRVKGTTRVVLPVRQQCSKYARILVPWEDDKSRKKCLRLCTAQMSPDGEYYSLNDQEVFACELRDPRHAASSAMLDEFDAKVVAATLPSEAEETFDVDKELGND